MAMRKAWSIESPLHLSSQLTADMMDEETLKKAAFHVHKQLMEGAVAGIFN